MNRIREIRKAAGMSSDDLGRQIGLSGAQVRRLELGLRPLNQLWMDRISEVLGCTSADLISNAWQAEISQDVVPMTLDGYEGVSKAMLLKGLWPYRVSDEGSSVVQTGIKPGDVIIVDQSNEAIAKIATGDVVLVQIVETLVLRCFFAPNLLLTNRPRGNSVITTDDNTIPIRIAGVVIRG